jgi:hypothetical protein
MAVSEVTILPEDEEEGGFRHDNLLRRIGGAIFGTFIGALLSTAFSTGLFYHFASEPNVQRWGLFLWGEHWAVRVVASLAATLCAGYAAGVIARRHGQPTATFAALPGTLGWLAIAILSWRGHANIFGEDLDFHASIGNKLAASILALITIPLSAWAGRGGEQDGQRYGRHFDSRRHAILGIRWYHYFWLPFFTYIWFAQAGWAAFYGFNFLKVMWKTDFGLLSLVPAFFMIGIFYSLHLMCNGAGKAYAVLSGTESMPEVKNRAWSVLKHGFGSLILAVAIQFVLLFIFLSLAKLFATN